MSLDAIGIASGNMQKSVEFYQLMGVSIKEIGAGADHMEGTTASGVRIMLDSFELMKKINPEWKEPTGAGLVLCFKQDSPNDVNELFLKVTEAGFKSVKNPWDAFWGQRYASVQDPDGNQIDIFASL
ncbi:hypothetical protein MNBD_NITROSPINAE01-8 [hydrothermal vent metagenome]|uniref:VOC domain-containing protein n=1 Tax=hydrothermal vent metagenome TaxID=652676 RepID=A0A3B1CM24_9ZZZZ